MNNDGCANIKGHAAEIIIGNYTGVWYFFHSRYYIWWIIYSDYMLLPRTKMEVVFAALYQIVDIMLIETTGQK